MNHDTWNELTRYVKSACKDAFKTAARIRLCDDPYANHVIISVDGRRRTTIANTLNDDNILDVSVEDDGNLKVVINDKLMALGNFVDSDIPRYPDADDFRSSQLRKILRFFSTRNVADEGGLTSSFFTGGLGTGQLCYIFKHQNEFYFSKLHNHSQFAILKTKFDEYIDHVKRCDFVSAMNYDDNVSEYLREYGIADGRKLLSILNDGISHGVNEPRLKTVSDDDLPFDSDNNVFSNFKEDTIRLRIREVGSQLKELDRTLTLLQYADITLKKAGGMNHIHNRYVDRVKELVDKTYSGLKGKSRV